MNSTAETPVRSSILADVVLIESSPVRSTTAHEVRRFYAGTQFRAAVRYAERSELPWYVLSTRWGLLRPDDVVSPYDLVFGQQSPRYRATWGESVATELELELGALAGRVIEIHATPGYAEALREPLHRRGAIVDEPLRGLTVGRQLAWYRHPAGKIG